MNKQKEVRFTKRHALQYGFIPDIQDKLVSRKNAYSPFIGDVNCFIKRTELPYGSDEEDHDDCDIAGYRSVQLGFVPLKDVTDESLFKFFSKQQLRDEFGQFVNCEDLNKKGCYLKIVSRGVPYWYPFLTLSDFHNLGKFIKKEYEHSLSKFSFDYKPYGCIYLIKSEFGVKIGKTKDPCSRTSYLAVKMPFKTEIFRNYCVPLKDMSNIEKTLHSFFKSKRKNGEWFSLDNIDIIHIDESLRLYMNYKYFCHVLEWDKDKVMKIHALNERMMAAAEKFFDFDNFDDEDDDYPDYSDYSEDEGIEEDYDGTDNGD